jgi:hypothetical protein
LLAELISTRLAFAAFLSLAMSDFWSDAVALDFVSCLVVVEAAWPKLNMLSKPRTATNIRNLFVIFMRTLSFVKLGERITGPTRKAQAKTRPPVANPAGGDLLRQWR